MSNLSLDEMTLDSKLDLNPSYFPAPCPGCGAEVSYAVGTRRLHCTFCDWVAELTREEAGEFLFARTGCSDLNLVAFLQAVADRPHLTAPRTLASGKRVLPAVAGETPWHQLMRLGAQGCLNGAHVLDSNAAATRFRVASQERRRDGSREIYTVVVGRTTVCSCAFGQKHPGSACAHIALVYLALTGTAPAAIPVRETQARAAAALDDLYGAA